MTIHLPKWLLIAVIGVLVVVAVGVGAYFLGRSSEDTGTTSGASDGRTTPAVASAECSKSQFEKAVDGTEMDRLARKAFSLEPSEPLIDPPTSFGISVFECADLDGDGIEEMIGGLAGGASFRTGTWGIFRADGQDWDLAFFRDGFVIADVDVEGERVLERVATYGVGDPLCCPSGERVNEIASDGGEYGIESLGVSSNRGIAVSDERGVIELGPLDTGLAGPTQATAAFGTPTSAIPSNYRGGVSDVCDYEWADLGLSITFVNLGGDDSCGREGRIQYFSLEGNAAEQAGWRTTAGVRVGLSQTELAALYPAAERAQAGVPFPLIEVVSPIGDGGPIALLGAKLRQKRVLQVDAYVGSAGE